MKHLNLITIILPIVLIFSSHSKNFIANSVMGTELDEKAKTFEGDVSMSNNSVLKLSAHSVITKRVNLWNHSTIPYQFSSHLDEKQRRIVLGAMTEIERDTCINFEKRMDQPDYIFIQLGTSCLSNVGRNGGKQNVTLRAALNPRANCLYHGEVLHELMHAIGFWHEQSRPDRDNFINIRFPLMRKSASKSNFDKHLDMWDFNLPYDYSSVMHYPKDAFQKYPSAITIVPLIKGAPIGLRGHLSHFDKLKINLLYKCNELNESQ